MINPTDQIQLDDQDDADKADQKSQEDIHSNGFDEENIPRIAINQASSEFLDDAYRASESAYLPGETPGSDYRVKSRKR